MTSGTKVDMLLEYLLAPTLDFSYNRIESEGGYAIGESLRINTTLTTLDLTENGIEKEGGCAIGEALRINSTLTTLHLHRNNIGDEGFSALLRSANFLKELDISENMVTTVPTALASNQSLTKLTLRGNPLIDPKADIVERLSLDALKQYLLAPKSIIPRVMLQIVGYENVSKTYLCHALLNNDGFNSYKDLEAYMKQHVYAGETHDRSTHGIQLHQWQPHDAVIQCKDGDEALVFNLFDFAGQPIYYGTHRHFLGRYDSVYVTVFRVDRTAEDSERTIRRWLNLIASQIDQQWRRLFEMKKLSRPAVVVVGTFDDLASRNKIQHRLWFKKLLEKREFSDVLDVHPDLCFINHDDPKTTQNLRDILVDKARRQLGNNPQELFVVKKVLPIIAQIRDATGSLVSEETGNNEVLPLFYPIDDLATRLSSFPSLGSSQLPESIPSTSSTSESTPVAGHTGFAHSVVSVIKGFVRFALWGNEDENAPSSSSSHLDSSVQPDSPIHDLTPEILFDGVGLESIALCLECRGEIVYLRKHRQICYHPQRLFDLLAMLVQKDPDNLQRNQLKECFPGIEQCQGIITRGMFDHACEIVNLKKHRISTEHLLSAMEMLDLCVPLLNMPERVFLIPSLLPTIADPKDLHQAEHGLLETNFDHTFCVQWQLDMGTSPPSKATIIEALPEAFFHTLIVDLLRELKGVEMTTFLSANALCLQNISLFKLVMMGSLLHENAVVSLSITDFTKGDLHLRKKLIDIFDTIMRVVHQRLERSLYHPFLAVGVCQSCYLKRASINHLYLLNNPAPMVRILHASEDYICFGYPLLKLLALNPKDKTFRSPQSSQPSSSSSFHPPDDSLDSQLPTDTTYTLYFCGDAVPHSTPPQDGSSFLSEDFVPASFHNCSSSSNHLLDVSQISERLRVSPGYPAFEVYCKDILTKLPPHGRHTFDFLKDVGHLSHSFIHPRLKQWLEEGPYADNPNVKELLDYFRDR